MSRSPNLFLLAAPRSGSTQLARWLATHPEIGLPLVKEPNFFAADDFPEDYVRRTHLNDVDPATRPTGPAQFAIYRSRTDYESLFEGMAQRYLIDASTSYLPSLEAPGRITKTYPEALAIVLTRDPVERALSHYGLALRTGRTRRPLAEELERELNSIDPPGARYLLRPSRTEEALKRIEAAFEPARRLRLTFEEMIAAPRPSLARIADFLSLAPDFDLSATARNASAAPRLPRLNAALHHSGLKTALRRSLPASLKPVARAIWFGRPGHPPVSAAERAALERALGR